MSRDEIKLILGENATEEQITKLLNAYHTNQKDLVDKLNNANTKLNSYKDYDELKSKLNSYEQAKLTEQEKIDLANKQAQETLAKANKIYYTAKAKEILAGLEDDDDIISTVVGATEEETIAKATKLANRYNSLKDDVAKKTREELSTLDIKPGINEKDLNTEVMTMDKFMSLSSDEQNKFATEHPEEFARL